MKTFFILILISFLSRDLSGQNTPTANDTIPDEMPSFPGGSDAMYRFIFENIRYPAKARMNGIQGTVIVKFIVGLEGEIYDIHVEKGIGSGCDEEVIRIIALMNERHRWKPGIHEGHPVVTNFTVPIVFRLR